MEPPRGRRTALAAAAVAAAVMVAGLIAGKDLILERWWIHRLGSEDEATWMAAAERLGAIQSRRAIPALVEKYGKVDDERPIVWALFEIGPPAISAALPAHWESLASAGEGSGELAMAGFQGCLEDPRREVRILAARGLLLLGRRLRSILPSGAIKAALLDALRSGSPSERGDAIDCLALCGQQGLRFAVPALAEMLESPDASLRCSAAMALEEIPDPRVIPALAGAIWILDPECPAPVHGAFWAAWKSCGREHRNAALPILIAMADGEDPRRVLGALGEIGPGAEAAVPAILRRLEHDSPAIAEAVEAIVDIGPAAAGAAPALAGLLADGGHIDREGILRMLGSIGPGAKVAVPAILAVLEDPVSGSLDRVLAASALARIAPEDRRSLDAVRSTEGEWSRWLREELVAALGSLARHHQEAVAILTRSLEDSFPMGPQAARALGDAGPAARSAIPSLQKVLHGSWAELEIAAAGAIWRISGDAGSVVPVLAGAVHSPLTDIRSEGARIIAEIGPAAGSAVPDLLDALEDRGKRRDLGPLIDALGSIGAGAVQAVPALVERLSDRHLSETAADALARIGPAAVPALAAALGKGGDWTRYGAARALAALGARAGGALPALEKALSDDDDDVRALATRAVAAIRGEEISSDAAVGVPPIPFPPEDPGRGGDEQLPEHAPPPLRQEGARHRQGQESDAARKSQP